MAIENPSQGVRKVNELVVQDGRALVLTESSEGTIKFAEVPYGTMKINSKTGILSVKIQGYSDWVQYALRTPDGTLAIIKDERVMIERWFISKIPADGQIFECYRRVPKFDQETGLETGEFEDTYRTFRREEGGFLFELEDGEYQPGKNQICVILDDCLYRDSTSGGIKEWSERAVLVKDQLYENQEVTVKYQCYVKVGNPAPRVFLGSDEPDERAEIGDWWLDYNGTLQDKDLMGENVETTRTLRWDQITNRPTTLTGYGITDAASKSHTHAISEITGLESYLQERFKVIEDKIAEVEAAVEATKLKKGPRGRDATVKVGLTKTGDHDDVINIGNSLNAIFEFTLQRGAQGSKGDTGLKGDPGFTGPPGPAGKDGINGIDGMTVSSIATSCQSVNTPSMSYTSSNLHALPNGFTSRYVSNFVYGGKTVPCCFYIMKNATQTGTFMAISANSDTKLYTGFFNSDAIYIRVWA